MDTDTINKRVKELSSYLTWKFQKIDGEFGEKSVTSDEFDMRFSSLMFLLIDCWCICRYYQTYHQDFDDIQEWVENLKRIINYTKSMKISDEGDKKQMLTLILITYYDFNKTSQMKRLVPKEIKSRQKSVKVGVEFSRHIHQLVDVLASDEPNTDEYIQNTFKFTNELNNEQ